jgi:hypothetical protein
MIGKHRQWIAFVALALLALTAWPGTTHSCPFCNMQGQTLTTEVNQASMVLFGTLTNAKVSPTGDLDGGTTDLVIDTVIKKHDILGDKKTITLNRYVSLDGDKKYKWLVFCDVFKGKIDPYRGVPVKADSDIAKFLTGALAVKDKEPAVRLKFFFDYLDNDDTEVANDAYKEFANADYKDYKDMAKALPAAKIAKWLRDPNTPAFRFGLYASMLGHCGKDEDAKLLRDMLDDPQKRGNSGIDGVLAGYVMLKPTEGWDYIKALLKDAQKDFLLRYAGLRAVRFLWEYRPDLVDKKVLVAGICQLLDDKNIADLAIEDLRKWQRWECAEQVLGLFDKAGYDVPIIRRAIIRFALSCPQKDAGNFVAERRKKDPQGVADVEEFLKLEATPAATTTPAEPPAKKTGSTK